MVNLCCLAWLYFFSLRLTSYIILLQYLFYIWGSNTSCQTTGKEEQMCSILIPRFQIKHFIPHTLIKCMCLFMKSGIYIVKRMSTLKNCCQYKAVKNYNLWFFSTSIIPSLSLIKKNSKKEHFLTSQRNNCFSDVIISWHGIDTKIEFPCFLLDTPTINNSCPRTWIQRLSQSSLAALLTPLNHLIFQYKRTICQGSNYTICF